MIPRLYDFSTSLQDYSNRGYGSFDTIQSCVVREVLNGEYTLNMEILRQDRLASLVRPNKCILAKPNPTDNPQIFIIMTVNWTNEGKGQIQAQHIKYMFFNNMIYGDVTDESYNYTGTPSQIWSAIENDEIGLVLPNHFTFQSNINTSNTISLGLEAVTIGDIFSKEGGIRDTFRGDLAYDNFTVSFNRRRGKTTPTEVIRYGYNMSSFEQEISNSTEYTHVLPFADVPVKGAKYDGDISTVRLYGTITQASTSSFQRIKTVDFSNRFKSRKGYVVPSGPYAGEGYAEAEQKLTNLGAKYVQAHSSITAPSVTVSLNYESNVELVNRLSLGDNVKVVNNPINYVGTHRVTETNFDPIKEGYISVTIGNKRFNLYKFLRGAI